MVANWQTVFGMNLVALTTVMFYFITVYTPTSAGACSSFRNSTASLTVCVAITNFIWLPVGGAVSTASGARRCC